MYIFENIWECWIFTKHWTKFRNGIKTPIRIEYGMGFRYFSILEEIRVHFWRKYFNDYLHRLFYIKYRDVYKMYFFDGIFQFFFWCACYLPITIQPRSKRTGGRPPGFCWFGQFILYSSFNIYTSIYNIRYLCFIYFWKYLLYSLFYI